MESTDSRRRCRLTRLGAAILTLGLIAACDESDKSAGSAQITGLSPMDAAQVIASLSKEWDGRRAALCRGSHGRNDVELLKHAQDVLIRPLLRQLAVGDAVDDRRGHL